MFQFWLIRVDITIVSNLFLLIHKLILFIDVTWNALYWPHYYTQQTWYSADNVFVVILFVYRTYIDGIFIAYRWYVTGSILSYCNIVLLIYQLTDGTIHPNDHTTGFAEEVAVIWHINKTKTYCISHTLKPLYISYCISESCVYCMTFVYLSIIVRISLNYRVNEKVNGTVAQFW